MSSRKEWVYLSCWSQNLASRVWRYCKSASALCMKNSDKPMMYSILIVWEGWSLPSSFTDHYGNELAESLLPFLLQKAEIRHSIRKCGLGSPYSVNFVLQMPSERVYHFTGRPSFTINSPYMGTTVSRFTLQGIQSPPWRRKESKTLLSQAGVYAVGQFVKEWAQESLPAVVLHKDKTAQVAMANLDPSQITIPNLLVLSHLS